MPLLATSRLKVPLLPFRAISMALKIALSSCAGTRMVIYSGKGEDMIKYSSELLSLLNSYIQEELTLDDLCDGLFPYLEMSVYENARWDWEVSGEILACIYEVGDGAMQEENFRNIIQEFLTNPPALRPRKPYPRRLGNYSMRRHRIRTMARPGRRSKGTSQSIQPYAHRTFSNKMQKPPRRRAFATFK